MSAKCDPKKSALEVINPDGASLIFWSPPIASLLLLQRTLQLCLQSVPCLNARRDGPHPIEVDTTGFPAAILGVLVGLMKRVDSLARTAALPNPPRQIRR